jgi:hypothetical protein
VHSGFISLPVRIFNCINQANVWRDKLLLRLLMSINFIEKVLIKLLIYKGIYIIGY